jgi:hypothetical protein
VSTPPNSGMLPVPGGFRNAQNLANGARPSAYAIHAQILTHVGRHWHARSASVPTFYLLTDVQGITDDGHAVDVARTIIDPLGKIGAESLRISAYAVDLAYLPPKIVAQDNSREQS